VPVRQSQSDKLKANKQSAMSNAIIDGTIAATISTTALEILSLMILQTNSNFDELSFVSDQGYKIAQLKPPIQAAP